MDNLKVVTNIPGWAEVFATGGAQGGPVSSYAMVPLVYRCVRLLSDSLASVPLKYYRGADEVECPFLFDAEEWTWKSTAAMLLTGANYTVKLRNKGGKTIGLQWLNPTTVTPMVTSAGMTFTRTGATTGGQSSWSADEMLYMREFGLSDDLMPGVSAAAVALQDSNLIKYLTRFAAYYFENGAMPLTILSVDKQLPQAEVEKVQGKFKSLTVGLRNAWRFMVLRGGADMKPFTITPPLSDLVMPELYEQARRTVAGAFGIPQTMLEDAANFATAKEHRMSFWQDTVRPRGIMLAGALNKQVFSKFGLRVEYAFNELDIFQEDEANRAASLLQLVKAGVPLHTAMDILGYDLSEEQETAIIHSYAGEEDKPDQAPGSQSPADSDAMRSALFNWKRVALQAVKSGHAADVDFDHPAIPVKVADDIHKNLQVCQSAEDVQGVFKLAREWCKRSAQAQGSAAGTVVVDLAAELKRANDLLAMEIG